MAFHESFPKLRRTGPLVGAFFCTLLLPAPAAMSLSGDPGGDTVPLAGQARVVDGDTIDIDGVRIRLEGIDAPEMSQQCQTAAGEPWSCGQKAAALMRSLAKDNDFICDRNGLDKYGRTLATCYAAGVNVNEAMVRAGLAWAFVRYSSAYVAEEAEARAANLGVWQGAAEAPWDYRHKEWQVAKQVAPKGCAIKGNVSSHGHIYHMPWDPWYDKVKIDESRGKRWFCSENEAKAAGWRPAAHD